MTNQSSNKQLALNNFPPTTKGRKINKSLSVEHPGHLVGLSVDDWVAQGCLVWGLGWSHNCFLWAAQPPEPLHNWLSGWYSPPPFFSLSSPKPLDPPLPPLLSKQFSFPLFLPLLCQSIHSHSHRPQLNTSPVASSGPSKIRKNVKKPCLCVHLVQVCPHHLHKAKNCHKGVIFAWLQKHLGGGG